jgi:hypothetical protein
MPIALEYLIKDENELLHRNAHPIFVRDGRVTSQLFLLKSADEGQLSVQQNTKAVVAIAYQRYTARGFESCGIWSVTINECLQFSLNAYDDPLDDDSHAVIDLTGCNTSKARKIADKLASKARNRGCQYSPPAK